MNFKLATGSALVALASFATSNPVTETFYPAGHKISNANKIGSTNLTENYQVDFSFTVGTDALGDAWRNILHIGNNDLDRRPALFFGPGSLALYAGWNTHSDYSVQSVLATAPLEIGSTYQIAMRMLENTFTLCVDGVCQDSIYAGTNYQDESMVEIWGSAPRKFNIPGFYSNPDSESNFGRIDNLRIREVIRVGEGEFAVDVFGADLFGGSTHKISNANKIGLTKVTENFHVEFSFTVGGDALGDAWRNIFHIGSNDHDRRPALFFTPGTLALHAAWNTHDDFSTQSELNTEPLEIGSTYLVAMSMLDNRFTLCVDGACQDTIYSGTNYQDESNYEIWASAPRDFQEAGFYSNPDSSKFFGRIANLRIREVIANDVFGADLIQFMSQSN